MQVVTSRRVLGTPLVAVAVSGVRPKTSRLVLRNLETGHEKNLSFSFDDYKADHYVALAASYAGIYLTEGTVSTTALARRVARAAHALTNKED